jgi:hypothetical protein
LHVLRDPMKWIVKPGQKEIKSGFGAAWRLADEQPL